MTEIQTKRYNAFRVSTFNSANIKLLTYSTTKINSFIHFYKMQQFM